MKRIRSRGEEIRRYIIENVNKYPSDIARQVGQHFGITRQAANKHLKRLITEGSLTLTGNARSPLYKLCPLTQWSKMYPIEKGLTEDVVWRTDIASVFGGMPENVTDIWHYGFTEMFNNAIDHSEGTLIYVDIAKTAASTEMRVSDNGIGIFRKIQSALGLLDERHSVLELAKGKFTTDPANHSGEGIFFASRMFDRFHILSGDVFFSHKIDDDRDWILGGENEQSESRGTYVMMSLNNHTSRTLRSIYDKFTSGADIGFTKTVVPVELAQYGDAKLVSRSQAKRLLVRVELFKTVVFDFNKVTLIGQAFADEIFRVFAAQHPNIDLLVLNANADVRRMIEHARSASQESIQSGQQTLPGVEPPKFDAALDPKKPDT